MKRKGTKFPKSPSRPSRVLAKLEVMEQEKKSPDRTVPGKAAEVKPKAVEKMSVLASLKENTPKPKQADDRTQNKDRSRQRGETR